MKNLTIAGRLTKDAATRDVGTDKVTAFSVAVDDRAGKEKTTKFFECSLWGKRGETLAQYLTKGSSVAVSGDFGTREYDGKTYLTLRAEQVTLLGGKPAASDADEGFSGPAGKASAKESYDLDDSVPF
jgi:single-strand DNA-binding protein